MADVPRVAVDIAPIHSLVARVMEGIGTPELIVPSGASPHSHSLRPSEAEAIQNADVVFLLGEELSPWLADSVQTLAQEASVTNLLDAEGTIRLTNREGAAFEGHGAEDGHDAEHGHEGHDDHDDHDRDDDHENGHDHGEYDPHAWLSPINAQTWLAVIAADLSAADPENADTYFSNSAMGREEIEVLIAEINGVLDPVRGRNFIVFHDAYQYFENDFGFPASGAISISDASDPSPARIAEIQSLLRSQEVTCVLTEPQFNPGVVSAVLDQTEAGTGVIDPLGAALQPGPGLYPQLLRDMAAVLAECL